MQSYQSNTSGGKCNMLPGYPLDFSSKPQDKINLPGSGGNLGMRL